MAPSTDHLLHNDAGTDGTLSLALVVGNAVLLSATLLVYCFFCRRKTASLTSNDIRRERPHSELKKVVKIQESNGTHHGVIPPGSDEITGRQKHKSEPPKSEQNGSVVKDSEQDVMRRSLPLPPVSADPADLEDPLYACVKEDSLTGQMHIHPSDPGTNEKQLAHTSGSNLMTAVNCGDTENPDLLENINPLYTSVEEARKETAPRIPETALHLTSLRPNQETTKEPMYSDPPTDEPIYSVIRRDKQSVKKSPVIQPQDASEVSGAELEDSHVGSNHKNSVSPAAAMNPEEDHQVTRTSSFKLTEMIKRCESRRLKNSPPTATVIEIIDLEEPPPVPEKLFDVEMEAGGQALHAHEDNTEAVIGLED